jgi:thiamine-monophosphate kinase
MELKEIGEFGFIERFKPWFEGLVSKTQVGIGEDCAIISGGLQDDWLITTDLLIEEVHFLRNTTTPEQLGYKSLAVNLSDIAAMGGSPVGTFLSIAISPDIDVEYLDAFMHGYHDLSVKYNTPLLGGDTTRSMKHLVINVCVLGKCKKGTARKRSMAAVGDAVCVTGTLGDSAGGLQVMLNWLSMSDINSYLLSKHLTPEPRIFEGLFLANNPFVHAMIDISDGIASDLNHILKASNVAANIHLEWLPLSQQLMNGASRHGWNAIELAVGGGEDYELLFTVAADQLDLVKQKYLSKFHVPVFQIGSIISGTPEIHWLKGRKEVILSTTGFDHFQ